MRTPWLIVAALAIVGVSAPVATAADAPRTITGTVVLNDGFGNEGDPCVGSGAFADLKPGATVTVKDAHKKSVGAAPLGAGTWTARDHRQRLRPLRVPVRAAGHGIAPLRGAGGEAQGRHRRPPGVGRQRLGADDHRQLTGLAARRCPEPVSGRTAW